MKLRKSKSTPLTVRTNQTLPNQYIDYRYQPKDFIRKLSSYSDKNVNPLYSALSFTKYFDKTQQIKYQQPRQVFITSKKANYKTNQHVQNFKKLMLEMRKTKKKFSSMKINKKINLFQQFISTTNAHFENLNLDDGINPRNSFSRQNFKINHYLKQLSATPKAIKGKSISLSAQVKRLAHTQNIVQYLKQQVTQARYFTSPKFQNQNQQKIDIETCQRMNKVLRCKTSYCQLKYQAPYLQKNKLDAEIMTESRKYMSKISKMGGNNKNTI